MKITGILLTGFAFFLVLTTGCNRKLPCEKISSDAHFYRASGVAFSQRRDLAEDKAINVAKRNLVKEIARDLHKKTGMSEQLLMDSLKKGIKIQELEVVCKHNDRHKGSFRCSLAIEMPVKRFSEFGGR
ncbi:MAG: hypothetical protein U9Q98_07840 [Bacteroidota bacterium]|nr:hypothetical protein [Bacteroidota bacterium]